MSNLEEWLKKDLIKLPEGAKIFISSTPIVIPIPNRGYSGLTEQENREYARLELISNSTTRPMSEKEWERKQTLWQKICVNAGSPHEER